MPNFNATTDIADLSERVCVVTGGNSGLGEATVTAIAQHKPKKLFLAARSRSKAEDALSRIRATSAAAKAANIEILDLDLASLESVKAAATRLNGELDRLDILFLNGGIAMLPPGTTKDGYEHQFGTNYLGHALLTQLLMPKMLETAARSNADVRIIAISSVGHRMFAHKRGILFEKLRTDMTGHSGRELYAQSMLAKNLFSYELAKRYPAITASSMHPGTVKSGVWGGDKDINWFVRNLVIGPAVALTGVSNEEGAKTQLWCAFSKDVKNGHYYEPVGKPDCESKLSRDNALSTQLWKWTESELQSYGAPGWPKAQM